MDDLHDRLVDALYPDQGEHARYVAATVMNVLAGDLADRIFDAIDDALPVDPTDDTVVVDYAGSTPVWGRRETLAARLADAAATVVGAELRGLHTAAARATTRARLAEIELARVRGAWERGEEAP